MFFISCLLLFAVNAVHPSPLDVPGQAVANDSDTCPKWEETQLDVSERSISVRHQNLTGNLFVSLKTCLIYNEIELRVETCDLLELNISRLNESYMDAHSYQDITFHEPNIIQVNNKNGNFKDIIGAMHMSAILCYTHEADDIFAAVCNNATFKFVFHEEFTIEYTTSRDVQIEGETEHFSITSSSRWWISIGWTKTPESDWLPIAEDARDVSRFPQWPSMSRVQDWMYGGLIIVTVFIVMACIFMAFYEN